MTFASSPMMSVSDPNAPATDFSIIVMSSGAIREFGRTTRAAVNVSAIAESAVIAAIKTAENNLII